MQWGLYDVYSHAIVSSNDYEVLTFDVLVNYITGWWLQQ